MAEASSVDAWKYLSESECWGMSLRKRSSYKRPQPPFYFLLLIFLRSHLVRCLGLLSFSCPWFPWLLSPAFFSPWPPNTESGISVFGLPLEPFACSGNEAFCWLDSLQRSNPTTHFPRQETNLVCPSVAAASSQRWASETQAHLCAAGEVPSVSPLSLPFSSTHPFRSDIELPDQVR